MGKMLTSSMLTVSLVLAFSAPCFAAKRDHRAKGSHTSGATAIGGELKHHPYDAYGARPGAGTAIVPSGGNLPYPDRRYGAPDGW